VPAAAATQNGIGTIDQTYGQPREDEDDDFP
jgi:hypothetical protein